MTTMRIAPFRIRNADVSADVLKKDLQAHPVPHVVVRRDRGAAVDWYAFDVDDDLLRKLKRGGRLREALHLDKLHRALTAVLPSTVSPAAAARRLSHSERPIVLLDAAGNVGGVAVSHATPSTAAPAGAGPSTAPAQAAKLFPLVSAPKGNVAAPGEILEYVVKLTGDQDADAPALEVTFPEGKQTLEVHAEISSKEFALPPGTPCSHTFVVDRYLNVTPGEWRFAVTTSGDRPCYSLDLIFRSAGAVIGRIVITAARRGASHPVPAHINSEALTLPTRSGAGLVLCVLERIGNASSAFTFSASRSDNTLIVERNCDVPLEDYFARFGRAADLDALRDVGALLRNDLPTDVVELLETHAATHDPLLIISNGRVAPFEMLQLRPADNGPFLGVEVPVVRWIYEHTPPDDPIEIREAACLRPTYQGADALKDAVGEEKDLSAHVHLIHAGTRSEFLSTILDNSDVNLLHFAGHAQASPALLKLEGGEILEPTAFHPKHKLLHDGRPFVFLNGCEIGQGTGTVPAPVGNLVKTLLKNGCRAVVAPFVRVDTAAARSAAETFYSAAGTETIGEAVRRVREHAMDSTVTDDQRATFLSYAAFAMPRMRLVLNRQPKATTVPA